MRIHWNKSILLLTSALAWAPAMAQPPPRRYVNINLVGGANNGNNWDNAYNDPNTMPNT